MDGAVSQRLGQCFVDEPVLLEQRQTGEARRCDGHLKVVAAAGPVFDAQLGGFRERLLEKALERIGRHAAMVAVSLGRAQERGGDRRTGLGMAPQRHDPYKNFKFRVEIDGLTAAAFREVSGLESETAVIEYRVGTDPNVVRKLPGLTKYANLVFKRGITQDAELAQWRQRVIEGNLDRRNGSIVLQDDTGQDQVRWNFRNGWPCKLQGPDLNAHGSDVAIETLEIAHEGLERV
jgi:phage tail-like protein